jgi:hypothetical protein
MKICLVVYYGNILSPSTFCNILNKKNSERLEGFLGAKSTSIRDCVGWLVHPSVRRSVPHDARLRGKLVTSRLLREEVEEETDYVAIPLRRDSFAPRD